jgi:hypothetical protein
VILSRLKAELVPVLSDQRTASVESCEPYGLISPNMVAYTS